MNACFCCVRFSFFSIPRQEIGLGTRLRNDLFCVEWDIKPQLSHSTGGFVDHCDVKSGLVNGRQLELAQLGVLRVNVMAEFCSISSGQVSFQWIYRRLYNVECGLLIIYHLNKLCTWFNTLIAMLYFSTPLIFTYVFGSNDMSVFL